MITSFKIEINFRQYILVYFTTIMSIIINFNGVIDNDLEMSVFSVAQVLRFFLILEIKLMYFLG